MLHVAMAILVYITLGLIILYLFLRRNTGKYKPIPGPKGLPLVGYGPFWGNKSDHETLSDLAEQYGEIYKLTVFGQTIVVLNSAKLIRIAFNDAKYKTYLNDRAETFYGNYVYSGSQTISLMPKAYDSDHSALRKAFAKGMHVYGEGKKVFEDRVTIELANVVNRIRNLEGEAFDMLHVLSRSLTNLLSVFLVGHDIEDDDKDVNMFFEFDMLDEFFFRSDVSPVLTSFPFLRFVPGMYRTPFQKALEIKETIVRRFYHEKKATYKPGEIRGLVDFMIKEQLEAERDGRYVLFTDEILIGMILETVAAGLQTTLSTLYSLMLCLMNYPECQVKIQAELDKVVDKGRQPTLEDRQACMYTEAVITEVLRYINAVPMLIPHFCEEGIEFEGLEIPPKSLVIPNVWYIHHDEKIWGDPWNFRPERWLDDTNCLLPNDHILRTNWLPFGSGRRQCPGESLARSRIFLYVATLLQRWSFEMPPGQHVSCDPRLGHFSVDLTIKPQSYLCKVVPRK